MISSHSPGTSVLTNLNEVLTTTRLRLDYERPVPIEVFGECLQLALQAPTGGAAEDWRWLVVAYPDLKAQLAELHFAGYDEYDEYDEYVYQRCTGPPEPRTAPSPAGWAESGPTAR